MTLHNPFPNITGKIESQRPLHGGDINEVFLLETATDNFVIKHNRGSYPQMFEKEAAGLHLLADAGLPTPRPLAANENYLLLEYLPPGAANPIAAGRSLAQLHNVEAERPGLDHDNYIGSLPQQNKPSDSWPEFYWLRRLKPQLDMLGARDENIWSKLQESLPELIPTATRNSLLHGDLWSGNLYWSQTGPFFIDPAVYYGDAMIELAFTKLFGAFAPSFYDAYREIRAIPEQFDELIGLYHIYPLLVHANLFGGSYYQSALACAKRYV